MPRKPCRKLVFHTFQRLVVSLFVFWFALGSGMAADLPVFSGAVSVGAASHPVFPPNDDKPHCPLRNLQHLSGNLLTGAPPAEPRVEGAGPLRPDLSKTLVSIDLAPPGHIPIAS